MNFKCQNCGSPLVVEEGQDRITCSFCQSVNLATVKPDGTISLSLVEKMAQGVKDIDAKADRLLSGQDEALLHAKQMKQMTAAGHLLTTTVNEYNHFIQNEFKSRMVILEEEKNKVGLFNGGCGCGLTVLAVIIIGPIVASIFSQVSEGVSMIAAILAIAAVIACVMNAAKMKRKDIQEKMDTLISKKKDYETSINDLKQKMECD
ncbi:MAG: zinc finger domain-containing protein [Thermoguttaceae bacterium]